MRTILTLLAVWQLRLAHLDFARGDMLLDEAGSAANATGLRVKGGAHGQAFAGGETHPAMTALASKLQDAGGVNRFTGFNDRFHAGSGSKHAHGLAMDVTGDARTIMTNARAALATSKLVEGRDYKLLNEYANPSRHATGGHVHIQFQNKAAANAFHSASAAAAKPVADAAPKPAAAAAGAEKPTAAEGAVKLAGARAKGGPVADGLSYLVGERGPEIFTPGASGQITTNGTLNRLADLGRMAVDGTGEGVSPDPGIIAKLRPQGGNVSTRGDTSVHNVWHIIGAENPAAVQRQVEAKFHDMIRQMESDQRGSLSD